MKLLQFAIILFISIIFSNCTNSNSTVKDYTVLVNLFIGTEGDGNTFPGATVPFGAVQLSPDTGLEGAAKYGSYKYNHNSIIGFSHTHLNGVGEPEYRDILMMPTVGKVQLTPGDKNDTGSGYRSTFDHKNESASPGYYSVMLDDYDVKVELTSTLRSGFHKYTFPKTDSAHIIIDLAHPDGAEDLFIKKISDTEIEGLRRSHGWAYDQYVYFVAQFSKPFSSIGLAVDDAILEGSVEATGKNVKAVINYNTNKGEEIKVKVGISAVSTEGARKNLQSEIPDWDFNGIVEKAKDAWNKELSKIEVEDGTTEQRTFFYTAMYHAFLSPDIYMDVDGKYRGIDRKVHQGNGFTNYTVFSLWDTFRALHPLFTIIDQERTNDFIKSLLQKYDDGGRLPMWALAGNYTDDMLGYHAVPVIVDAYMKGIRDYDVEKAFAAVKHSAGLEKLGLKYYKKIGYLPCDRQAESVSKTLEYCYNDWCISQMAKELGAKEDYAQYHQRAHFYKNVFDKSTGFMRGKSLDRSWLEPFDPLENSAYSEGNAYQYMFVPHDTDGLIAEMGGDKKFSQWLDVLFTLGSGENKEGSIGQYWHGNEPGHHLAYLYNYVGEPWKTQKLVNRIMTELHSTTPRGLSGNDDCGQMSAWYILSSMGFYSVAPGQNIYVIGSPLFEKATVNLENGNKFVVKANNISPDNIYIQSAKLDGVPYSNSYLRYDDIMRGAKLEFEMGPEPNKDWGNAKRERPYSENGELVVSLPYIKSGDKLFLKSTKISLGCNTKGADIHFTLDGSTPTKESGLYTTPFEIFKSQVLKIRAFHEGLTPSITVDFDFDKAELKEPVRNVPVKNGLFYDYYKRFFVSTEDIDALTPFHSGMTDKFTIDLAGKDTYFGFRYSGYIKIPKDGIYTFYLESNDGSTLFIDDAGLIENEANHGAVEEPGSVGLKAGLHKIMVKYFQCGGGKVLKVSWAGPDFKKHEVRAQELFVDN